MHLLGSPQQARAPDELIVRSLEAGPDYKPDWRLRVTERYLVEISGAEKKATAIDLVLTQERDPVIRQLVLFHVGRRCVIPSQIEYALRCLRHQCESRIPTTIKAMIVAGRSCGQVAQQVATKAINVWTYEKLAFDIRRYSKNRIWLRNVCFPPAVQETPCQYEARLLAIAFEGGWARLQNLLFSQQADKSVSTKADLDQLIALLAARALDFVISLETHGVPPSVQDLELLLLAQHRMPMVALPPFSPSDRTFDSTFNATRNAPDPAIKKLSPLVRRRIIALLERIQSDTPMKIDNESLEEGKAGE